ncbi:hypothetical protein [Aquimarina sp. MMG016]|uniref:hypothetical protein n=1 Tax=Aquimarina sp. MMG016 TaxID=2822690 RepID=UPI001B3A3534|nr:hypothetical protein [Aquimarina sp. MMG016]MBQ4819868.1 hypothetical protein [Aquimarina sp. MMG016]
MKKITLLFLAVLSLNFISCGNDDEVTPIIEEIKNEFTVDTEAYAIDKGNFTQRNKRFDIQLLSDAVTFDGFDLTGKGDVVFMTLFAEDGTLEGEYDVDYSGDIVVANQSKRETRPIIYYIDRDFDSATVEGIDPASKGTIKITKVGEAYTISADITYTYLNDITKELKVSYIGELTSYIPVVE